MEQEGDWLSFTREPELFIQEPNVKKIPGAPLILAAVILPAQERARRICSRFLRKGGAPFGLITANLEHV
jgi:hypothetical protein